MDDNDIMFFGTYKGRALKDIPASYLLYMYNEIVRTAPNKRTAYGKIILGYLRENKEALEARALLEHKPSILTKKPGLR